MSTLVENVLGLFGIEITPKKEKEDTNSSILSAPLDDDGATQTTSGGAMSYGVAIDVDGTIKDDIDLIKRYRAISLYPEIDLAIQDIVNEAVPQEDDSPSIELDLEELKFSDTLKESIQKEFKNVISLLKYNEYGADIFRRWYVEGRTVYQVVIDKENISAGIQKLVPLDAIKIRKIKEVKKKKTPLGVEVIDTIDEYFIYNEGGFSVNQTTQQYANVNGVKISPDAIIFTTSGYIDSATGCVLSYLHKAIRPVNQMRMLEDATIIYFISRAPERRIFYIDVENLPKLKADQYVKDIMNKYRNKLVYDAKSGEVRDDKKYMSMLEDYWMPRRGGKGTEIDTLQGANNITGMLDNVKYFESKLYKALNIPLSRLEQNTGFDLGRTSEITRDELKFQKFIQRLRRKFGQLILDALKTQLILKGICNTEEWEKTIRENIKLKFQVDNFFSEMKNQDIMTSRLQLLQQVDQYLGKYFSKEWTQKNILKQSDELIEKMKEEIDAEKDDPTAQPTMNGMGGMMGGDMMGQDQMGGYGPDMGDTSQMDPNQQGQGGFPPQGQQ